MADVFLKSARKALPTVRSTPISFTTAFNNHPIYDNILYRIPAASLLRLGRCSRLTRRATKEHLRMAMGIMHHLSRFFDNTLEFRSMQARTATLISGSTALQFFDRTHYPESDLDLYAHPLHVKEVGRWLLDSEGYTFQPSIVQESDFDIESHNRLAPMDDDEMIANMGDAARDVNMFHLDQYNIPGVCGVFTFIKPARTASAPPRKVQVIAARRNPLECILGFHSCTLICALCAPPSHLLIMFTK